MNIKQTKRLQNVTRILANRCSSHEHPFFNISPCGDSIIFAAGTESDLCFWESKVVVGVIGPKGGLKVRTNLGNWYVR